MYCLINLFTYMYFAFKKERSIDFYLIFSYQHSDPVLGVCTYLAYQLIIATIRQRPSNYIKTPKLLDFVKIRWKHGRIIKFKVLHSSVQHLVLLLANNK